MGQIAMEKYNTMCANLPIETRAATRAQCKKTKRELEEKITSFEEELASICINNETYAKFVGLALNEYKSKKIKLFKQRRPDDRQSYMESFKQDFNKLVDGYTLLSEKSNTWWKNIFATDIEDAYERIATGKRKMRAPNGVPVKTTLDVGPEESWDEQFIKNLQDVCGLTPSKDTQGEIKTIEQQGIPVKTATDNTSELDLNTLRRILGLE